MPGFGVFLWTSMGWGLVVEDFGFDLDDFVDL